MFFPFHDDNPTVRAPVVTVGLIAINVLAFLYVGRLPADEQRKLVYHRGFVPARIEQLRGAGQINVPIEKQVRHPFNPNIVLRQREVVPLQPEPNEILLSLLTCMFLHGGWLHLIGNMWFLWVFGNNVEDRLGRLLFLLIYLGGGLIATACHWAMYSDSLTPVIGASGAVAAVLGAYAITWPWARVHTLVFLFIFITVIDVPALVVLGVWFAGQLLSGMQSLEQANATGVAWWAHIGGFAAGLVLMPLLSSLIDAPKPTRRRQVREAEDDW
jgi:membrane associated rhomboid family serine protease